MSVFGIDGLVSGLDTTSLITKLLQVEAAPQTLLKQKSAATRDLVTGLQALNTKIASLAETATTAAKTTSWAAWQATSSAESATATASSEAQAGTLTFSIDSVATTQVSLSDTFTDPSSLFPTQPPKVTVRTSDGTLVTVEPASSELADVTKAINDASDGGVKATAVRVAGGDPPTYRLQFTGTATGTAGSFEVYAGTSAEVTAGTAPRLDGNLVRAAGDATVTLWKGTAYEQSVSQSSNTFSDLLTGVDVTVSAVTAADEDPVTITIARDDAALTTLASGLVGALGVVLSEISSRSAVTTTIRADGTTGVTGGLFSGDSTVRSAHQALLSAASSPVDGFSPAEAGIVLGRDGSFTFDEETFAAALAADPGKVQSIVAGLADRVATAAATASDKYAGSLTLKITGQEGVVKDLGEQIERWDRRLELRRESLQRTYSALEVTLGQLQSQSNWLAGQLAGLPTSSSGS